MSKSTRRSGGAAQRDAANRKSGKADSSVPEQLLRFPRNRLISKLLQDRSVLRLISAPRGYGKTSLAREYADRLFTGRSVAWVDASSPSFLADLDRGRLAGFDDSASEQPELIVLDDLPWMHEGRAETLSRLIDAALCRGVEVLATTLPSCDCTSLLQAERVFVSAPELEITEEECLDGRSGGSEARVRALRMWRRARGSFMGRVPAVAWSNGDGDGAPLRVLQWFFSEKLPIEAFRAAFVIAVVGKGPLSLLGQAGFTLGGEDLRMFARDYPFLGIDVTRERFSMPCAPLGMLQGALRANGIAGSVLEKAEPLMRRVLEVLLERGDLERVEEVMGAFGSDAQCAQWLLECGWTLLDRGEFELVDSLMGRCPESSFGEAPDLQVLRAWDSGLLGDRRESAYFAQKALRGHDGAVEEEDEHVQGIAALAYLALVTFGGKGASIYAKDAFSAVTDPLTPEGVMARTVDLCTDSELERALALEDAANAKALAKQRTPAEEERARALLALFTKNEERMADKSFYRLAFHLLCHVDSEVLKPVVSNIGCALTARSRQGGFPTCTGALVVRDLWRKGFFGSGGPTAGRRDAKLFEDAGRILRELGASAGNDEADVPWEFEPRVSRGPIKVRNREKRPEDVDMLNIRLFGSFEATIGDRCIKETEWRKKSRMLVTLLVLNSGRDVSRDTLFSELWPGMSRVRALDNFYSVWSSACALFGNGPYLERQESFCRINTRYVVSDVEEFEKLVRRLLTEHPDTNSLLDTYARLESLYRGGLVPSETDNQTINAQRDRFQAMYIDAMIAATDCSLKANDARLALWFARKAMETGQQREDLYQALARAQVAAGQRCSAIETYFECRQYLRENLGLDPSCDMQELYDRLISVDPSLLKLDPSSFKKR